jgi:hypothetical protein
MQSWWPKWISIHWGFHHPSAVYWHTVVPGDRWPSTTEENSSLSAGSSRAHAADWPPRIVTYREFEQNSLSPRMLAQAIVERTGRETIRDVYLSPDAFAHRTSEASIAEQLGDVLAQNGLPRPAPADDDRIGDWQLMYQLFERDAWVITENCAKLLECLPQMVRDNRRVEDIRKVEGDDPADAARYGIVPGARYAGVGAPALGGPGAGQTPPPYFSGSAARFVAGMPLGEQKVTAEDPTSQAIHFQRLESEAYKQLGAHRLPKRRLNW